MSKLVEGSFFRLLLTAALFSGFLFYVFFATDGLIAYSLSQQETRIVSSHIKNFVVIIQGRHTFDNYFGTFPGANGLPNGTKIPINPFEPNGSKSVEPFHLDSKEHYKPRDDPPTYRLAYNNGSMNGFIYAQKDNPGNSTYVMGYFDNSDIPYYWKYASEYVLADMFFSPSIRSDLVNSLYAIGLQPPMKLQDVPVQGLVVKKTIFDELTSKGIPWKVYVENLGGVYNKSKEDAVIMKRNIPILAVPRFIDNQSLNNVHDLSDFFADVLGNRLANVTFVYFTDSNDSPTSNVIPSQKLVANLIYALMTSGYWNSSAILLTHNEAGGWYDHVKPPFNNNTGELNGFRVPAIIISPYAKKGYIDSNTYDIKAFLDIVQSSFGLNGSSYAVNQTNKMFQAFDFEQHPRKPLQIREVPRDRILVEPDEIYGINTIYILSLFGPILVTIYWYYKRRK